MDNNKWLLWSLLHKLPVHQQINLRYKIGKELYQAQLHRKPSNHEVRVGKPTIMAKKQGKLLTRKQVTEIIESQLYRDGQLSAKSVSTDNISNKPHIRRHLIKSLKCEIFGTLYHFGYVVPLWLHCTTFGTLYHFGYIVPSIERNKRNFV